MRRRATHLRVIHTQGLDLVKGKQDADEKHLVLFLKRQGKAIDDTVS
jgi:predicted XRE-type DNA-binding protein